MKLKERGFSPEVCFQEQNFRGSSPALFWARKLD
jgi:hypothetical protein